MNDLRVLCRRCHLLVHALMNTGALDRPRNDRCPQRWFLHARRIAYGLLQTGEWKAVVALPHTEHPQHMRRREAMEERLWNPTAVKELTPHTAVDLKLKR